MVKVSVESQRDIFEKVYDEFAAKIGEPVRVDIFRRKIELKKTPKDEKNVDNSPQVALEKEN